ncbi:hypothetical protein HBI88_096660 [Parastagonospora nodorum]|nr:hypothetical protein HBI93_065540 [Parastagonospora nodorum]KAH5867463.1 hypothetical protein HBI90_110870 [Parastagonospora nodorum]KAH5928718.1 hypothetical protein HBI88_096660 [Parastagonospora nodorum]
MLINLLELLRGHLLLLARCGNEQYYRSAFNTEYEKSSTLLLNLQGARKRADSLRARTPINSSAVLLRARTLINLSAVLYEQSAARPSLPAKVSNIDLNFVPSVAFIPNVYIADSLRARTPINPSTVLYEQAAAQTSLPAKVSNIDLDFVPSVAFISNVHIADSLRARTPINLSAVLYKQAAAQTSLPAEVSNISPRARTLINPSAVLYEQADAQSGLPAEVSIIDLNFVPSIAFDAIGNVELTGDLLGDADRVNNNNNNVALTLQFSPTALLNPQSLASKRPALSSSDLNRRRTDPTIASQISLVEQLHNVQERTASPAKQIKTNEDCKKSTHCQGFNGSSSLKLQKTSSQALLQTGPSINLTISDDNNVQLVGDNIEKLIYVGKVKHTYVQAHTVPYPDSKKYLSNSSQQGRIKAYNISKFYKSKNIQLLQPIFELQRYDYYNPQDSNSLTRIQAIDPRLTPRELGSIYVLQIISKLDKVPTRELSSHIKTELYPHQKQALYFIRKFYRLVITSKDTHYKQTIKKAYIMSPERASLILFIT